MTASPSFSAASISVDTGARDRAETLLAGEQRVLEMIASGTPLGETLDAVCRLIEQVSPKWLASILLVDANADSVWHGAGPTLPKGFVAAIDGTRVGPTYGPCGLAAQGHEVVAPDIAADARWSAEYRELALQHGLRACWSTPIKAASGRVLGIFEIYLRQPGDASAQREVGLERFIHLACIVIERAQAMPANVGGEMLNALRRSEERYARAMEASGDGHSEWVVATDEFYASPRLLEMCGLPADAKFAGRSDFVARLPIHPEDRDRVLEAVNAHYSGTSTRFELDARVLRRGETRWMHAVFLCARDASGALMRVSTAITDFTDRKIAEDELRLRKEELQGLMESVSDYLWSAEVAADGSYSYRYYSPVVKRITGWSPEELRESRERWVGLLHPHDRPWVDETFRRLISGATERVDVEYRIVRRDGTLRWVRDSAHGTPIEDGRILLHGVVGDITERKVAEDEVRQRREELQRLMESVSDYLWSAEVAADGSFTYRYYSPVVERITGRSPEYLSASPERWLGLIHPLDRPRLAEIFQRIISGAADREDSEYRILRPDGALRWVRDSVHATRTEGGRILLYGVVGDITERKLAEESLRESEARFRTLTELSSDWYWEQDENLRVTYLSSQAERLTGYSRGNQLGKTRWELAGTTPLSCSWAEHQAVLAARQPFRDLEMRRVGEDGRTRYLSVSGAPIFDEQGRFKGYQGIGRNITERKRIEEELRESEARFRSLTELSSDWYWKQDENLRFTYLSSGVNALAGYTGESAIGKLRWELRDTQPLSSPWPEHQAVLAARQPFRDFEYSRPHEDGTIRYVSVSGAPIFDDEGRFKGYQGIGRDITERKRLERQLRQAQRLEAMGTLAGGIAHDFNNILGAILGYGEMALRDAPRGSRLRRDLDSIMTAGERGRALVDRVLAFSRSGVGERVAVPVEKVVREALDLIEAKLPEGVRVEAKLRAGRSAVMGDPTQVHQVLMNLGTNAVQAMLSGGTLSVSLEVVHETGRAATIGNVAAGEYLVLTVADTGTGIAREIIDRIFDPFFTTKEVGTGTGLGLSLVHSIVTELGGAIDVASTPGAGSKFTVYLSRSGDAAEADEGEAAAMPRGDGQRVLIVDDEEPLVRLAARTLEELGYLPTALTSSTAALAAFRADPGAFDAVITDERMPGITGSALIRELRGIRREIPILLMSGYVGGAVASRAREAGANEVMKKPVSARELATSLARVLHH
ncbi:MAG TPA: PAS domain S-box protein [Burkholderiales bacterium]|nr:PAS domain S-box protein [Burkholderiales bacterium]